MPASSLKLEVILEVRASVPLAADIHSPPSGPLFAQVLTGSLRKHVLSDLQPYVCVVTNCGFSGDPFPDRRAWLHHQDLEHGFDDPLKDFECPLCQENLVGHAKSSHLARHLEEISLTILPANAEESDDVESDGDSEDELDEDEITGELEDPDAAAENAATDSAPRSPSRPPGGFVCEGCGAIKSSLFQLK